MRPFTALRARSLVAVALLAAPARAWADPFFGPFWFEDTPYRVFVSFSHGPALPGTVHNEGPFTSPSGYWRVGSLQSTESSFMQNLLVVQRVELTATLQHILGPDAGEGAGPVFNFSFTFDASQGPVISPAQGPLVMPHPGQLTNHSDIARAFVNAGSDPADGEIKIYNLNIEAVHTPEPATWLLLATGLAAALGGRRVRRRPRRPGGAAG
jgi:hypothetical protein